MSPLHSAIVVAAVMLFVKKPAIIAILDRLSQKPIVLKENVSY